MLQDYLYEKNINSSLMRALQKQGWKLQEGMYDWPEGMPHLNYPDDPLPLDPRSLYKDKLYKEQFAKFEKAVA